MAPDLLVQAKPTPRSQGFADAPSVAPALVCGLILGVAVLLSRPFVEMGVNDDWSYIWIARGLADTGHITYNGWASAILGWQLFWGALFFKLFGFSFTIARFSILCLAMVTAALLQRILVRFGIISFNATVATLAFVLCPVFFPLAFSFMTDVPGILAVLLCLYLCLRCHQAGTTRAAVTWLVLATVSNVLLGSVRQTAWLGALVLVPSTVCLHRRSRAIRLTGIGLWMASAALIAWCMHWFSGQPYALSEAAIAGSTQMHRLLGWGVTLMRSGLVSCLVLLPVLIAFAVRLPEGDRRRGLAAISVTFAGVTAGLSVIVLVLRYTHHSVRAITPFSNNLVTARGFVDLPDLLGHRPDVIPVGVRVVLFGLIFASLLALWMWVRSGRTRGSFRREDAGWVGTREVVILLGPYTVVYLLLLVTRANLFDRYLLPVLFVPLILLLRFYQVFVTARLPAVSLLVVAVFGSFSVASMHDLFAMDRARLEGAEMLRSAGLSRSDFRAGYEYDSWTQLELSGYINDSRIRVPAHGFHQSQPSTVEERCAYWFSAETPDVHARYGLSYEPAACRDADGFRPIRYETWLAPHDRALYVQQIP